MIAGAVLLFGRQGTDLEALRLTVGVLVGIEGIALVTNFRGLADRAAGLKPEGGWTGYQWRWSPAAMRFYGAFFVLVGIIIGIA